VPISSAEQQHIQQLVDAASADERNELKAKAEATLSGVNARIQRKAPTPFGAEALEKN